MLLLTAAENRKILQSMAENKRGLSAGLRPESGGGLFTAVAFLRRINFVQIAARFRRRMAGGQRLVDVPSRHAGGVSFKQLMLPTKRKKEKFAGGRYL